MVVYGHSLYSAIIRISMQDGMAGLKFAHWFRRKTNTGVSLVPQMLWIECAILWELWIAGGTTPSIVLGRPFAYSMEANPKWTMIPDLFINQNNERRQPTTHKPFVRPLFMFTEKVEEEILCVFICQQIVVVLGDRHIQIHCSKFTVMHYLVSD